MSYKGGHRRPKKKLITHPRIVAVLCIVATVLAFSNIRFFRDHVPGVSHIPPIPGIWKHPPGKPHPPQAGKKHHKVSPGQDNGAPHHHTFAQIDLGRNATVHHGTSHSASHGTVLASAPVSEHRVSPSPPGSAPGPSDSGSAPRTGVGVHVGVSVGGGSQSNGDSTGGSSGGSTPPSSSGGSTSSPSLVHVQATVAPVVSADVNVASPNNLLSAKVDIPAGGSNTGDSTPSTGSSDGTQKRGLLLPQGSRHLLHLPERNILSSGR